MYLTVLRRLRDDDGISLVEIMVAIVVLGIALTAFAGTITSALATITRDEQFVRGNQVAADLVEEARAQSWDCIGLDQSASGFTNFGSDGDPMVEMDTGCTPQRVNLPTHQVTVDTQTYDVTQEIVWVDDSAVTGTEDHKRITVTLDWTVRDVPYTVTQESLRVPTPTEVPIGGAAPPPVACDGRILDMTITPNVVAVDSSGQTAEPVVITVETCEGTLGVTVSGGELGTYSLPASPAGSSTRWELTLNPGMVSFTAGTQTWSAQSSGTVPLAERQASESITFYEDSGLPPVEITSVTPTPGSPWCIEYNGPDDDELRQPVTVEIVVAGIADGSEGTVTLRWTNPAGSAPVTFDPSTNTWIGTIPAGTPFPGGGTALYVDATRTADNEVANQTAVSIAMNRVHQNPGCPT